MGLSLLGSVNLKSVSGISSVNQSEVLGALLFNGTNNYSTFDISEANLNTLFGTTGTFPYFTYGFFAKFVSTAASQRILSLEHSTGNSYLELRIGASYTDSLSLVKRANDFSSKVSITSAAGAIVVGTVHHIAIRCKERPSYSNPWLRYDVFVDGVSVASSEYYDNGTYGWNSLAFGAYVRGASKSNYSNLISDDHKLYNIDLSDENIADWALGNSIGTNLVAHWTFDETEVEPLAGYNAVYSSPAPTYVTSIKKKLTSINYQRISPLLNFNYGQNTQDGSFDAAEIYTDLDFLHDVSQDGSDWWVRVQMSAYNYTSGVDRSKQLANEVISRGGKVMWGVSHPTGINDASWAAYTAAVMTAAGYANTNNYDVFSLGNELEYTAVTDIVAKIISLNADVKASYPSLVTAYSMAQSAKEYTGASSGWISTGKGTIDLLCYNAYGDNNLSQAAALSQWQTRIDDLLDAFPTLQVTEWSYAEGTARPADEEAEAVEIATRRSFLSDRGVLNYVFTYRWDTQHWSLHRKPAMDQLLIVS